MRAYASAIGLDPDQTVKEFLTRFPEPEESPADALPTHVPPAPKVDARRDAWQRVLRIDVPTSNQWFTDGARVTSLRLRCLALAVDVFVLCVLAVLLFAVLDQFWAPLAVATALYFVGSILFLGNTPGITLFAVKRSAESAQGKSDVSLSSGRNAVRPTHDYEAAVVRTS